MDGKNSNVKTQISNTTIAPTDGQVPAQQTTTQQPAADLAQTPVGAPSKEAEGAPVSEFIKPSETSPDISSELSEFIKEEEVKLPDHEIIKAAGENVPVSLEPSGAVQLPMTEAEALKIIKTDKNLADSLLWLAKLIERIYQQIRLLARKSLTG